MLPKNVNKLGEKSSFLNGTPLTITPFQRRVSTRNYHHKNNGGHTIAGTYTYTGGVLNFCYTQGCIQYSQAQAGSDGMSGMSDVSMSNNNHIEFHAANDIVYHLMRWDGEWVTDNTKIINVLGYRCLQAVAITFLLVPDNLIPTLRRGCRRTILKQYRYTKQLR